MFFSKVCKYVTIDEKMYWNPKYIDFIMFA